MIEMSQFYVGLTSIMVFIICISLIMENLGMVAVLRKIVFAYSCNIILVDENIWIIYLNTLGIIIWNQKKSYTYRKKKLSLFLKKYEIYNSGWKSGQSMYTFSVNIKLVLLLWTS